MQGFKIRIHPSINSPRHPGATLALIPPPYWPAGLAPQTLAAGFLRNANCAGRAPMAAAAPRDFGPQLRPFGQKILHSEASPTHPYPQVAWNPAKNLISITGASDPLTGSFNFAISAYAR